MQLKKLAFLEGVFDDRPNDDEAGFDTDVMLATGELTQLIPALIEALGGEIEPGAALPGTEPAPAPAKPKQEAVTAVGDDDDPPF